MLMMGSCYLKEKLGFLPILHRVGDDDDHAKNDDGDDGKDDDNELLLSEGVAGVSANIAWGW